MADFSVVTSMLMQWLLSPVIWIVIIFIIASVSILFMWIRKKRKLIYQCLEVVNYSRGKTGFNLLKAGWYGKNKFLRLYDWGEEQVETQDGELILNFSTEDFQEINGKRGIVVARDPVNPDVLVPINNVRIKGEEMLAEIAPAEYRDAAISIIKDADKETADYTKRIMEWVIIGGVIIFAVIAIIIVAQMIKNGQKEASDLIIRAGDTCLKNARDICNEIVTQYAKTSTAP